MSTTAAPRGTGRARGVRGARAGLVPAVLSELHKFVSVRSTWWFVGGAAIVMVLNSLLATDDGDPATVQSVAVAQQTVSYFLQYILTMLGAVAVTGEFVSRSITVTFACTPSRTRVIAAKAIVVGGAVFAAGAVVAALGVGTVAVRFGEPGLLGAGVVADVAAMGLCLALLAMLGLGIGTLVRRSAGVLAIVVLLLVMVPELMKLAADRFGLPWLETVIDYTPGPAGWHLMTGGWEYAAVMLAWAVAALAAGGWVLRVRDV